MGWVSRFQPIVEPGRKRLNESLVLKNCKLPEIPVFFVECEPMALSEAKLRVDPFMTTRYPSNLEESPGGGHKEVESIDVLSSYLEGEADLDLADLTGGSDLTIQTSIPSDHRHLCTACSAVNEPIPSSVADLLLLAIQGVEVTSRACILEVRFGPLESTLLPNHRRIGEVEQQIKSKNSVFEESTVELQSIDHGL